MTVEANNKKIIVPWQVFVLIIGIITGGGGVFYGWAQQAANSDHRVILQHQQMQDDRTSADEAVLTSNTFAISELKSDIAAIKANTAENTILLHSLIARLK